MQEEKDYLQRDIERITLFLKTLLRRVAGFTDVNLTPEYDQLEKELQTQIDFSLQDLSDMDTMDLDQKMASLPLVHIEKLAEIAFELLKKQLVTVNPKNFAGNVLYMLEYINRESSVFSLHRQQMLVEAKKYSLGEV